MSQCYLNKISTMTDGTKNTTVSEGKTKLQSGRNLHGLPASKAEQVRRTGGQIREGELVLPGSVDKCVRIGVRAPDVPQLSLGQLERLCKQRRTLASGDVKAAAALEALSGQTQGEDCDDASTDGEDGHSSSPTEEEDLQDSSWEPWFEDGDAGSVQEMDSESASDQSSKEKDSSSSLLGKSEKHAEATAYTITEEQIKAALHTLSAFGRKTREAESKETLGGLQETCVSDASGKHPTLRSFAHVEFGCCGNGKRPESMFGMLCRLHRDGASSSSAAGVDHNVRPHSSTA